MIRDILFSVSSVSEFREKLLELRDNRSVSARYFSASLEAESLLKEIDKVISYKSVGSMKFIVYPNESGVDLFVGGDIEHLSGMFGWDWKELCNV